MRESKASQPLDADEDTSELADTAACDPDQSASNTNQPGSTLDLETRMRIEELFRAAHENRTQAVVLKRELDRLGVFNQYEDRFLDLFKKAG